MTLDSTLVRAAKVTEVTTLALHEKTLQATLRNRAAISLLGIAIDHQNAIVELLRRAQPIRSSALALVRPTFETFVRGTWLLHCATDQQVEAFAKDLLPLNMASMVQDLDEAVFIGSQKLQPVYADFWARMCSFTHSGGLQIQRWNTDTSIEPNYDEAELVEAVDFATAIAIQAGIAIASQMTDRPLAEHLLTAAKAFAVE